MKRLIVHFAYLVYEAFDECIWFLRKALRQIEWFVKDVFSS